MYIGWVHYYTPKVFSFLSFLINPLFVYLVFTDKKANMGKYRYLLTYFATFNIFYSTLDILVPAAFHDYRYCFFFFVSDGLFAEANDFNHVFLLLRCSMVSCSYAVLITHFAYRYLIIHQDSFVKTHFVSFVIASFLLAMFYYTSWAYILHTFMTVTPEMRDYIQESFYKEHGESSQTINAVSLIFNEVPEYNVIRSWTCVALMTTLPSLSIAFYIYIGYQIMKELGRVGHQMSPKTKEMQKNLFNALVLQTAIPIVVSYTPCIVAMLAPTMKIELGRTMNYSGVIALALFPFFDPLAIILCLPVLRNRVVPKSWTKTSQVSASA